MNNLIRVGGNIAAVLGIVVCVVSGATRVLGGFYVNLSFAKYEAITLFIGGMGLMLMACLAKLQQLLAR